MRNHRLEQRQFTWLFPLPQSQLIELIGQVC